MHRISDRFNRDRGSFAAPDAESCYSPFTARCPKRVGQRDD